MGWGSISAVDRNRASARYLPSVSTSLRRIALVLLVLIFSAPAHAEKGSGGGFFAIDIGPYMTQVEKRFAASPGYATQVSSLAGFLRARKSVPLFSGLGWEPSVGLLIPWISGADGFAKTFLVHTAVGFGYAPLSWWRFRIGPGLLWRLTITNAEQVSLNNGTGSSGFYIPGGSRSRFQFTADFGMDLKLFQSVSLGFDVWIVEIASSARRSMNAAITLGFYL